MLPVLHCQHLEHSDEGHRERLKVGSGELLIWPEVEFALEDLTTKQGVNEDEDEHEDGDEDEVSQATLNDTNDHRHRLESAQYTRHTQHTERSKDSDSPESLEVASTPTATKCSHENLDDREKDDAAIKQVHNIGAILFRTNSHKLYAHFDNKNPCEDHVEELQVCLHHRCDVVAVHSHNNSVDENASSQEVIE